VKWKEDLLKFLILKEKKIEQISVWRIKDRNFPPQTKKSVTGLSRKFFFSNDKKKEEKQRERNGRMWKKEKRNEENCWKKSESFFRKKRKVKGS
jgi:hypothetical protein